MKKKTVVIIALVCLAIILASTAITLYVVMNKKKPQPAATKDEAIPTTTVTATAPQNTAADATTETSPDPSTGAITETAADATQAPAALSAPDTMTEILAQGGSSLQQLSDIGCTQLVTVSSSGSSAQLRFFSCENNTWTEDETLFCSGFVGRNGVTSDMHEGGNASPFGLYHIGDAFYINDQPATGLNSFRITSDTYWVDDPDSSHYNQHMEGTAEKDWNSAEHMIDISGYRYGFVIDYNTAAAYGKGSAIFFHISSNPTAGCVGTDESSVLAYLAKLNASANPFIMIV
ncbi:hypothetical protein [uncultured Ruminococcus sp.]|uniref:L,D-transpeptidase family protein n=1 Tax=uncultured Ruminococcus sp. TaxID=165186 RepID=UPI00292E7A97|nr:hypothetical protein [uncultured Ruminococcus sp.]